LKKRILSLLLVLQIMLSMCPVYTSADAGSILCGGSPVSAVEMNMAEAITLQSGVAGSYQWQIEAREGLWVNINGETGAELRVSYGMLANVLRDNGANIRCSVDVGGSVVYTAPVRVSVSYESAVEKQAEPIKPETLPAPVAVEDAAETETIPEPEAKEEIPVDNAVSREEAIAAAQTALDAAKAEYAAAQAALETAAAELDAANAKAAEAGALVNEEAVAAWQDAKTVANAAANNFAAAESAYTAAQAAADAEPENEELAAAAVSAAAALETALAEKAAVDEALALAAAAVDMEAYENARIARAGANAAAANHANAVALCAAKEQAVADAEAALEKAKAGNEAAAVSAAPVMKFAASPARFAAAGAVDDGAVLLAELPEDETLEKHIVSIEYLYADSSVHAGEAVAFTWTAELPEGSAYKATVASPVAPGYVADQSEIVIEFAEGELTGNVQYKVYYSPALMTYPVHHYVQNVNDDQYSHYESGTATGYTEAETPEYNPDGEDLANDYEGLRALPYVTDTIAADGSTEVVVYYDRNYYLMFFELGENGYGVDPIYARYGSSISVAEEPVRPGYTFKGWLLNGAAADIPATMPPYDLTYVADWEVDATAPVSVVFWGENPDDEEYSYIDSKVLNIKPGTEVQYDGEGLSVCGYHSHDASCYQLNCTETGHSHNSCTLDCNHVCNLDCYSASRGSLEKISKPTQTLTDKGNGIYTYRRSNKTYYCLNIGDSWYASNWGGTNEISYDCVHTNHTDGCYTCGKTEGVHVHSDYTGSCYQLVCDKETHEHTSGCYVSLPGLDSNLYTFVRSEKVTVEADGSTVINVYFDRKEFSLIFKDGNNTVATIIKKWGTDISSEFQKAPFNSTYNGRAWKCTETNKYGYALQTLDKMPQFNATFTLYNKSSETLKTIYYYLENVGANVSHTTWPSSTDKFTLLKAVDTYFNYATYEEEYHEIEGFSRYSQSVSGFTGSNDNKNFSNNKLNLFYLRNSYQLIFNNGFSIDKSETVEYGAALSTFEDYTPEYPSQYEAGTRYFDGWYLNPECSGEQFDLTRHTMPSNDLILYAKWTPYYYEVKVYTDASKTEQIGQTVEIMHGKFAQEPEYDKQSYGEDYEFIAWFYTDENGKEQAFDFANMPVKQPLEIYAKWKSNLIRDITVMYVVLNADGSETEIAETEIQRAYVGSQKTFDAKTGNQLYEGYREGFYPGYASSSVLVDVDESKNIVKFVYQEIDPAPYTVEYWVENDDGSLRPAFRNNNGSPAFVGEDLISESEMYVKRVTDNRKSVVTENYINIPQYVPDSLQKKLIITTDESQNVIRFIYSYDPSAAIYTVNHHIAKLSAANPVNATDYDLYINSQITGVIGQSYSANPINIPGFTLSTAVTANLKGSNSWEAESKTLSGVLKDNNLTLDFYYVRNPYPYEVRYIDADTGLAIAPTKQSDAEGNALAAPYGSTVVENAIAIEGYNVDAPSKSAVIKIASNSYQNPIVFYYSRKTADIKITKTVDLNPDKAAMGLTLPAGWENLEFSFSISSSEPLHKQSYTGIITHRDGTSSEIVLAKLGDKQLESVSLRHGETVVVKGLALGGYTLTESRVTGYSPSVNGQGSSEIELKLENENALVTADYTNTYPYYTGDLVLEKSVKKLDESDPDAENEFIFTVKLMPAEGTLDEPRPIRLGDSIVYTIGANEYWADPHSFTVSLRDGESKKFTGIPEGRYTVEESLATTSHYITDYYKVSYDKATNDNVVATGSSNVINGEIVGGHEVKISYTNTYKKGDLIINKSLLQEYEKDNWAGDSFRFEVSGSTALPDGDYRITAGGKQGVATVSGGRVSVKIAGEDPVIAFEKADNDTGNLWSGSLKIEDLPAGIYQVVEAESRLGLGEYETTVGAGDSVEPGRTVSGLKIPDSADVSADFTNSYIRNKGDLRVSKEISIVDRNESLDDKWNLDFEFNLVLTDGVLENGCAFEYSCTNGTDTTADDGLISGTLGQSLTDRFVYNESSHSISFRLRHGESLLFKDLPVGEYTVSETYKHGYNSSFDEQPASKDSIVAVTVTEGATADVDCVNSYPAYYGDLIIEKKLELEGELDKKPESGKFSFKVQLSDTAAKPGYSYDTELRDADGKIISGTVVLDEELSFIVELAEDEAIKILQLNDCQYTITESGTDVPEKYNTSWTVDAGESTGISGEGISLAGSLDPDDVDTVVFTNEYKRQLAKLEITKTGAAAIDENQSFIFNISGQGLSMDVVLNASNNFTATLSRLPVGEYTVSEKSGWSWRYSFAGAEGDDIQLSGGTVTIPVDDEINSLTVSNGRGNNKWLNGADAKPNLFN